MRNLRHFWRQPDLLVFSTIQPVMFVVLFVYVFGGAVGLALPPGVTYVDYLLPGIFVQSVTFRASNTAVGLSEDLRRGVIDRFRSMPMARSAVLLGRTTADLVRNILIIGLMVVVGYLVGFRFQAGVLPALGMRRPRRRLRVRAQLDLRVRLFGRPWRRDRADGRVRAAVSARLRELGLRPGLDPAELAAADRRSLAGDADGGRRAHARAHRRCAGFARGRARLDRRNRGGLRAALGLALPEDELTQVARLYAATGDGFARLDEAGEAWAVELSLSGSGAQCLAVDPADPGTVVYVGLREGGVRRSVDGGRSWIDCELPEAGGVLARRQRRRRGGVRGHRAEPAVPKRRPR